MTRGAFLGLEIIEVLSKMVILKLYAKVSSHISIKGNIILFQVADLFCTCKLFYIIFAVPVMMSIWPLRHTLSK